VVDVNDSLLLTLTLTLDLAAGASNEVLVVILDKLLGVGPLLVSLAALVGLADLEVVTQGKLLLSLLGKVVGVGDVLVLRLGGLCSLSILGNSLLQLALGNLLAGLLVLLLGLTLGGTPGLGSLLLGTAK
jgi:hypothetical protein